MSSEATLGRDSDASSRYLRCYFVLVSFNAESNNSGAKRLSEKVKPVLTGEVFALLVSHHAKDSTRGFGVFSFSMGSFLLESGVL